MKRSFVAALSVLLAATSASAVEPKTVGALVNKSTTDYSLFRSAVGEKKDLPGGAKLTLSPGAEISRMPSLRLQLGAGGKTPTHVFRLAKGRVDVSIPPEQANKIAVLLIGPGGNSSVSAEGHMAAVLKSGAVRFTAFDAEMLTGRGSQWRTLRAGGSRAFNLQAGSTQDAPTPKAPLVAPESGLKVAIDKSGFDVGVTVGSVKHASRYQVALVRQEGGSLTLVDQVETTQTQVRLSGTEPGHYAIVARALDEFGIEGAISAPKALRVLGVQLPKGAEAKETGIVLPPHQRVGLVAAEGLEMTYGNGDYFVGAPSSVGMSRGASTLVRFRDPASKAEVSLTMIPRHLRAKVRIGPRTASWPRDRVEIRIELVDEQDAPVPAESQVEAAVTVNLAPTEVSWQRRNNVLSGTVSQPRGEQGPWVVRVEVKRNDGHFLARDFLEVAKSSSK